MSYNLPLIDKQDNSELIRNKIAEIIATEQLLQQGLAPLADPPQDPLLYELRVYIERSNPWDVFDAKDPASSKTPIINVWRDGSNFPDSGPRLVRETVTKYNIDVFGYGESKPDGQGGHIPADRTASLEAQRGARLVRNILDQDKYRYLDYSPPNRIVTDARIIDIQDFRPTTSDKKSIHVEGARIVLRVKHKETVDGLVPETLETIYVEHRYEPDGQIIAEQVIGVPI